MAIARYVFAVLTASLLINAGMAEPAAAQAERRVALVIGNGKYEHSPTLTNPVNDARAISNALKEIDFEVVEGFDLDHGAMQGRLREFLNKASSSKVALLFYAGHGIQVDGRNYLVPVDAKLESASDLNFGTVDLDRILASLDDPNRANIIILDACRDNPLTRSFATKSRSGAVSPGLAAYASLGTGTLIAFSTAPGKVAADGDGSNSPFTEYLVRHLRSPGLEVRQMLTRVRSDVARATGERQVPWDNSSLRGDVYLAGLNPPSSDSPAPRPAPLATPVEPQKLVDSPDLRTRFKVAALSGSFYARRGGVIARRSPSKSAAGTATLQEGKAYPLLGKSRDTDAGSDDSYWYMLSMPDGGVAFAFQSDVFSEYAHRQKLIYDEAIGSLDELLSKARSENSGRFSRHFGIYSMTGPSCDGNQFVISKVLMWFRGDSIRLTPLANPSQRVDATMRYARSFKGNKGTMEWYSIGSAMDWWEVGDFKVAFMGNHFAYNPRFSAKNVNYNTAYKCTNEFSMIDQIKRTWRGIVEELSAEEAEKKG